MNGSEGVGHCKEDGYETGMNNIDDELMNIDIVHVCMFVKCRLANSKPLA